MKMTLTTKTPTGKNKKGIGKTLYANETVKSKSPAKKVYPTGKICKNEGCNNIGMGDEYCSTVCAKEDNGVAVSVFLDPSFSRPSRLGKPRGKRNA